MHNDYGSDQAAPLAVYSGPIGTGFSVIGIKCTNQQPSIYVNGDLVQNGLPSLRSQTIMARSIGYGSTQGPAFSGDIAEILVFNRVLTDGECLTVNTYLNGKYSSVPVVSFISPTNNAVLLAPADIIINVSAGDFVGINQVQIFQGTTSLGVLTNAPYSLVWSNVLSGVYGLTAIATDNNGRQGTSTVNVVVDIPPRVVLTAPASNIVYVAGSDIKMSATAWDVDGGISQVQFLNGFNKLGTVTTEPYNFIWSNAPAGNCQITAIAVDNYGLTSTSGVVNVIVDTPPSITLTNPVNGAVYVAGTNISIGASASDSDGTILQVEFFQGATSLGIMTNAPFTMVWSNSTPGIYALTARATDNNGIAATSGIVSITVAGVVITNPKNNLVLTAPANVAINAVVTDNTGINHVEYYQGTNSLGVAFGAPYGVNWTNIAAGVYVITAFASDNNGLVLPSKPVNLIVDDDPYNSDRDMDGISDYIEYIEGRNPLVSGSVADSNGIINLSIYTPLH